MRLTVVIPALNEEATIADVIGRIPRSLPGVTEVGVVVVDDGSTDKTGELAAAAGAKVIRHPRNLGVGAAFQTGVEEAISRRADLMVNMDGDGQFNPEDIALLVAPIVGGQAEFVSASRFKDPALYPEMSGVKFWGNQVMSRLISFLTGKKFYDVSCGFRAYSKSALLMLNLFGEFTYTQETFLDLSFKNVHIVEVPVRVRGRREFGTSRVASNILAYALRTSRIIFSSFKDYRPMAVFGGLALIMFAAFLVLGSFLGLHYLRTGAFTPYKWIGFLSGTLLVLGFLTFITGLLADMLKRMRITQERVLYLLKKHDRDS